MVKAILCFLSFLLPAIIYSQQIHGHDHELHLCETTKSAAPFSGTYEQNPLLWHYQVSFYGLEVNIDPAVSAIGGSLRVLAQVVAPGLDLFVLEFMDNMTVDSVVHQGELLSFDHSDNELKTVLPYNFSQQEWIDLRVYYHGFPQGEGFFSGFQKGVTPYGKPVLWTLSEPLNARQWWPVKQVLEDKADSVAVSVTTPAPYVAASNGLLTLVEYSEDHRVTYHWKSNYPIAYYLVSLAVSEYAQYNFYAPLSQEGDQVFVQNFIYDDPAYLLQQQENIEGTMEYMRIFSTLFGDYPFASEKYGHATAPMGGGMEHQTMSTMVNFTPDLVSHELSHQWFGNSVTCATWSDIWINEGFASYGEYLAREFLSGLEVAKAWMDNAHNSVLSLPNGSVYVPPVQTTDIWRIFNGRLSYRKGAAILHMLRHEINDDPVFFLTLRTFLQQYQDSVATGDDFMRVAEQVSGRSWQYFFDQWYYGEGHPIFEMQWWQENGTLFLRSKQSASTQNPSFFFTSIDILVQTDQQDHVLRVFQDLPEQVFSFPMEQAVQQLQLDPENWLLKQATLSQLDTAPLFGVTVTPNPFSDTFIIQTPYFEGSETYKVFDMMGRVVVKGNIQGFKTQVILPETSDGLLILEVTNRAAPWVVKIIQAH